MIKKLLLLTALFPAWGFGQFVPVTPCRVADTRLSIGPFGGPALVANATRIFTIPASACNVPLAAKAYSLNITAVPQGVLAFLTVWPAGGPMPLVSTLNAQDGQVTANAALVPAGVGGGIAVFAPNGTHLVIDVNGYFLTADPTEKLVKLPRMIVDRFAVDQGPVRPLPEAAKTTQTRTVQFAPAPGTVVMAFYDSRFTGFDEVSALPIDATNPKQVVVTLPGLTTDLDTILLVYWTLE